jgi:hypothetical protein
MGLECGGGELEVYQYWEWIWACPGPFLLALSECAAHGLHQDGTCVTSLIKPGRKTLCFSSRDIRHVPCLVVGKWSGLLDIK